MKEFVNPELTVVNFDDADVIVTSNSTCNSGNNGTTFDCEWHSS